jgi:hypothetical protein
MSSAALPEARESCVGVIDTVLGNEAIIEAAACGKPVDIGTSVFLENKFLGTVEDVSGDGLQAFYYTVELTPSSRRFLSRFSTHELESLRIPVDRLRR